MGKSPLSVNEIVEEIMSMHRSLPPRPSLDEVEAAIALIKNVEKTERAKQDMVERQTKPPDVPDELFSVLQEMQKNFIYMQSQDEKREALALLDLEERHRRFDDLVQRASETLPQSGSLGKGNSVPSAVPAVVSNGVWGMVNPADFYPKILDGNRTEEVGSGHKYSKDDSYIQKPKASYPDGELVGSYRDGRLVGSEVSGISLPKSFAKSPAGTGDEGQKLSLIKVAGLVEATAKKGAQSLDLQGKLMDQLDWLPDSIGKLTSLIDLNLSENRIVTLPESIGGLSKLTKLDLHANQLFKLPDSIGRLSSLTDLDLHGNRLTTLPASIGDLCSLVSLDVSSNQLSSLPDTIGHLANLKRLNIETNEIEEFPYTIGQCSALIELRADFNCIKALPEAVGKLGSLEVLTLHYNRIKSLPTTMGSLYSLKELDVSFNELESIPESLCFVTSLVKLNVGRNFADLRYLPRSIGNLEMLEELDISNNQIRILPDSFAMLKNLRILHVDETPLEVPPRHIVEKGAQAAVQYMTEYAAIRDGQLQMTEPKGRLRKFCSCLRIAQWKQSRRRYVKA